MELIRLSDKHINKISDKYICCVENNAAYFGELFYKYNIQTRITAIVDENARNMGSCIYQENQYPVYEMSSLKEINYDNTVILITSDYYKEYFEKIKMLLVGQSMPEYVYFFPNKETEYELEYREYYKNAPLKNIIVFRSGPHASGYVKGMDFSDNARALFEYMLKVGLNEKYELVWFVKNPGDFSGFAGCHNVTFLPFDGASSEDVSERDTYYNVLCLAKYFFFTDAYGFVRNCREDQIRVQLWHGCGFKTRLNFTPCEKRYDYMTVTSEIYADIHAKLFGLRKDQMLVTGCAKEDWLYCDYKEGFQSLGIPKADKYIFWLPTYRFSEKKMNKPIDGTLHEETGLPMLSSVEEVRQLNDLLFEKNTILIIKLHPFQDRSVVHIDGLSNIILIDNNNLIEKDIQINQLLGGADAIISDYSSVAVDYLLLDRPMAFITDDVKEYEAARGFIFDNILEWLPGKFITSVSELIHFIDEIVRGVDSSLIKRKKLMNLMHKNMTGSNCKRILEALGITGLLQEEEH